MTVSFYDNGNETTGSVSNRIGAAGSRISAYSSAKNETTGSCGYETKSPTVDTLEKDEICFRGRENKKDKSSSLFGTLLTFGALTAIVVGGLGYAHKKGLVNKISNERIKGWLKNSNKITEPCYNACKTVKNFCTENYDKIIKKFKK